MEICLTSPASGVAPTLLAGRFDPMRGACALLVGPAETQSKLTRKSVAFPVFRALGKNSSLVGSYTNSTNEYRSYIPTWFAAYETKDLVVFNGKVMSHGTLAGLFEYAAPVERVTFVAEPGDVDRTRQALTVAGYDPTPLDWDALLARLPVLSSGAPDAKPPYDMSHLPVCDFLLFRNRARLLNTPERFAAIDHDYRTAYQAALTVKSDLYAVIDAMADLCRDATTTAQMLVVLRGTQQALLTRGWHLAARADKTLGTLSAIKPPAPTDAAWAALHGYTVTRRPATAALYLVDVPATPSQRSPWRTSSTGSRPKPSTDGPSRTRRKSSCAPTTYGASTKAHDPASRTWLTTVPPASSKTSPKPGGTPASPWTVVTCAATPPTPPGHSPGSASTFGA